MVQKYVHTFLHRRDWGWEGSQRLKTLRKSNNHFCGEVWIIYGATYDFVHACQVWQRNKLVLNNCILTNGILQNQLNEWF